MKKVVMCGVRWDSNLGDAMLMECTAQLFREAVHPTDIHVEMVDFFGRSRPAPRRTKQQDDAFYGSLDWTLGDKVVQYCLSILARMTKGIDEALSRRAVKWKWRLDPNGYSRMTEYLEYVFQDAALIVLAGGGIIECSSQHDYHLAISLIIDIAEKYSVPVVFNAVGVVGRYREKDWRCSMMKKALNSDVVRYISVRDSLDIMNEQYLGGGEAKMVADSAVWASEVHNILKDPSSDVIGIGLIRPNAFRSYGVDIGKMDLIEVYRGIIRELEDRGYNWRLFSNGLPQDHEFGLEILNSCGQDNALLINRPLNTQQLIRMIAQFRALICCRLHACIIAYSLDIPAVALSWNSKINQFMRIIGTPQRAIDAHQFDPLYIVDSFERAMEEGFDQDIRSEYRTSIRDSIQEAVQYMI